MVKKQLYPDTYAYIFDELAPYVTIVYLIIREDTVFVLDSYCGPGYIQEIIADMGDSLSGKRRVLINTHHHWDHIWGNTAFLAEDIYAHETCPRFIKETFETDLKANCKYFKGEQKMRLPGKTFSKSYDFPEHGIKLLHTPGHTADSISILDFRHNALYTGDNLEHPIIMVMMSDIGPYLKTLAGYLDLKPDRLFASHTLELTAGDVKSTIEYLQKISRGEDILYNNPRTQETHQKNISVVASGKC